MPPNRYVVITCWGETPPPSKTQDLSTTLEAITAKLTTSLPDAHYGHVDTKSLKAKWIKGAPAVINANTGRKSNSK